MEPRGREGLICFREREISRQVETTGKIINSKIKKHNGFVLFEMKQSESESFFFQHEMALKFPKLAFI